MDHIIEVSGLKKSYGEIQAVKGISFFVERGKLFAFLGPNGAGKSTTIDMICTFLQPDEGTVTVDGFLLGRDDEAIRANIGAVFQDRLLDALLTVRENLRIRGSFYGLRGAVLDAAVRKAADATGISELLNRPYGKLSGGQRRRCDIARALVHTPKILFLDEPTTGLDPQTRRSVWETVTRLQRETDMTIFLTTHYMEEAAEADYVVVIDNGVIAAKGTPTALKESYASDKLKLHFLNAEWEKLLEWLKKQDCEWTRQAEQVTIRINRSFEALPLIEACRSYITGFEVLSGTMDDAFIGITGKELRD